MRPTTYFIAFACLVGVDCGTSSSPKVLSSLDEECEVKGHTAAALLKRVPSHLDAWLIYAPLEYGGPSPALPTPFAADFAYAGGKISCLPGDPSSAQPPYLRVEVTVALATNDGAFIQTVAGTLYGSPSAGNRTSQGIEDARVPARENRGSFTTSFETLDWSWNVPGGQGAGLRGALMGVEMNGVKKLLAGIGEKCISSPSYTCHYVDGGPDGPSDQ